MSNSLPISHAIAFFLGNLTRPNPILPGMKIQIFGNADMFTFHYRDIRNAISRYLEAGHAQFRPNPATSLLLEAGPAQILSNPTRHANSQSLETGPARFPSP